GHERTPHRVGVGWGVKELWWLGVGVVGGGHVFPDLESPASSSLRNGLDAGGCMSYRYGHARSSVSWSVRRVAGGTAPVDRLLPGLVAALTIIAAVSTTAVIPVRPALTTQPAKSCRDS